MGVTGKRSLMQAADDKQRKVISRDARSKGEEQSKRAIQNRSRPSTKVPTVEFKIFLRGFRRWYPFDALVFCASSVMRVPEIDILL